VVDQPSSVPRRMRVVVLLLLLGGCRGGCTRPAPPDALLSRLPAGTRFVVSVDLDRIRSTPLWTRVAALAEESPDDKRRLARLTERTGLDPLRQIHRVVAAFPDDARTRGEFALIIDGENFDERRLVAFAREESGAKIEARRRGARTLWSTGGPSAGFFLGARRFVLGGGGWADVLADLADGKGGPGAAGNLELVHLVQRTQTGRALWFAALVPLDVRQLLMADPKQQSAGSVTRLGAGADLGPGLTAELVADLSNDADARALQARIQASVRESKRNAKVLMLGLGPYLDALQVAVEGPTLHLKLALTDVQTKDLLERAAAIYRLTRGARGHDPR
jgi:hypothetical protein